MPCWTTAIAHRKDHDVNAALLDLNDKGCAMTAQGRISSEIALNVIGVS